MKRKISAKRKVSNAKITVKDINENMRKKEEIDKILGDFKIKMEVLEQKRDRIVNNFFEVLKQKQIAELKKSLKF